MSEPFIGEIKMWGCNFAPRGWAFCDGKLMDISQNPTLYAVIGTIYGGDGRTTMALPNLQGRAPMMWGRGVGLSNFMPGETTGFSGATLNSSQIPSHDHIVTGIRQSGNAGTPAENLYFGVDRGNGGDNIFYLKETTTSNTFLAEEELAQTGESQAHENRQPLLAVNFCIAIDGLFPSRN